MAEQEGFEPPRKTGKTVAALRGYVWRCHFHCHFYLGCEKKLTNAWEWSAICSWAKWV